MGLRFWRGGVSIFYDARRELFVGRTTPRNDPITVAKCIMSLKPEEIDELLNGMLDGVLTDDEQRRVDSALELDPSLQARLDEMSALRRSLLRGRSVGRLGPDFAKRIVLAARERADLMDNPPEWIKPQVGPSRSERESTRKLGRNRSSHSNELPRGGFSSAGSGRPDKSLEPQRIRSLMSSLSDTVDAGTTRSSDLQQRAWRVWIPSLLAITAASAAIFFVSTQWSPSNPSGGLAVVTPGAGEPESRPADGLQTDGFQTDGLQTDGVDVDEQVIGLGMDIIRDPKSIAQQPQRSPENQALENHVPNHGALASDSLKSDPSKADATMPSNQPSVAATQTPSETSSDAVTPNLPPAADPLLAVNEAIIKQFGVAMMERLKSGKPVFTLLADVKADLQASENRVIDALMEKYEITFANDLTLDDEQLNVLVDSRIIGAVSGGSDEGVRMYFLRAEAWRINEFLLDVQSQYQDFPEFRLDLAYDTSVLELQDQLGGISDPSNRVAHRIEHKSSTAAGNLRMVVGSRQGKPLDLQERLKALKDPASGIQVKRTETSYLLLMVRSESE
jgi:hypothetical protein